MSLFSKPKNGKVNGKVNGHSMNGTGSKDGVLGEADKAIKVALDAIEENLAVKKTTREAVRKMMAVATAHSTAHMSAKKA
jgi:hypothetical protein